MPTNQLYLNLITSRSNIWKVTLIIMPSTAGFNLFLYYTFAGLRWIRSCNLWSTCSPEKWYLPFLNTARRLSNGYYILKFKNMQWWFQQSTQIRVVGLIVLTGSSGLPYRVIHYIMFLSEQLLDRHMWCERMLHQIGSLAYGLSIIMCI